MRVHFYFKLNPGLKYEFAMFFVIMFIQVYTLPAQASPAFCWSLVFRYNISAINARK